MQLFRLTCIKEEEKAHCYPLMAPVFTCGRVLGARERGLGGMGREGDFTDSFHYLPFSQLPASFRHFLTVFLFFFPARHFPAFLTTCFYRCLFLCLFLVLEDLSHEHTPVKRYSHTPKLVFSDAYALRYNYFPKYQERILKLPKGF